MARSRSFQRPQPSPSSSSVCLQVTDVPPVRVAPRINSLPAGISETPPSVCSSELQTHSRGSPAGVREERPSSHTSGVTVLKSPPARPPLFRQAPPRSPISLHQKPQRLPESLFFCLSWSTSQDLVILSLASFAEQSPCLPHRHVRPHPCNSPAPDLGAPCGLLSIGCSAGWMHLILKPHR